jgi:hypothetical protein
MDADRVRTSQPWHLTRNVILLVLVVLGLSLALVLLQKRGNPAPLLLFNILAVASIGLVLGMGTRTMFRRRPWPIKALVSASLCIVGLAFLGGLTNSQSGIGPLRADFVGVDWLAPVGITLQVPTLPRESETDLADAAYILIAIDVSWIALRAWTGTRQGRGATRPKQGAVGATMAVTSVPEPIVHSAGVMVPARAAAHARSRPMVRPIRMAPVMAGQSIRRGVDGSRRRNALRRRPAVQIAAYEEHRCPYCLQDIKRDDLRGSVECPICHTLHHKDCWDITGTCQVPHLNG